MTIQQLPAWIGSQAVAETGQQWMSAARPVVHLPSTGWMSEMAGKSRWNLGIIPGIHDSSAGVLGSNQMGSYVDNISGLDMHSVMGFNGYRPGDVWDPMYISIFNSNTSGIRATFEGYQNSAVFSLPNSGWINQGGAYVYEIAGAGVDLSYWLAERAGQRVNMYLEPY